MEASIVDLRYRMKDVLRAIDRGETVTVTYRGKEKARLVPSDTAAGRTLATLGPGSYHYQCDVGGHDGLGQNGWFTVTG